MCSVKSTEVDTESPQWCPEFEPAGFAPKSDTLTANGRHRRLTWSPYPAADFETRFHQGYNRIILEEDIACVWRAHSSLVVLKRMGASKVNQLSCLSTAQQWYSPKTRDQFSGYMEDRASPQAQDSEHHCLIKTSTEKGIIIPVSCKIIQTNINIHFISLL